MENLNLDCIGHLSEYINPYDALFLSPILSSYCLHKHIKLIKKRGLYRIPLRYTEDYIYFLAEISSNYPKERIKFFMKNKFYHCMERMYDSYGPFLEIAIDIEDIPSIIWCINRGEQITRKTCTYAGRYKKLKVLRWFVSNVPEISHEAISWITAINNGDYKLYIWANEKL